MHVVHVVPYLAPAWAYGRVPHEVSELARAQAALGHRVVVLTTTAMAPHERLHSGASIDAGVHVVRVRNVSGAIRTWLDVSTPIGLRRHARRLFAGRPPDAVHLHEIATVENLRVLPCVPPSATVVVSAHGAPVGTRTGAHAGRLRRAWHAWAASRVVRRMDRLLVDTESDRSAWRAWLDASGVGTAPPEIAVIPPGIDLRTLTALQSSAAAAGRLGVGAGPVVVATAKLSAPCFREVLDAAAVLTSTLPAARLLIVGSERDLPPGARDEVRTRGLEQVVSFAGYLPTAERRAAYAAADALLVSALIDGHEADVVEALASGLPLLATRAVPQDLADSGAVRVLAGSSEAWRDVLRTVLCDAATLDAMRAAARRFAERRSWSSVAKDVIELYRR